MDFDTITETAVQLFTAALERGLPTEQFIAEWDKVMADVLRRYPGTSAAGLVLFAAGQALGRWEARHGLLPKPVPHQGCCSNAFQRSPPGWRFP